MKFRTNLIKAFSVLFAVCVGFAITTMPAKAQELADFSVVQAGRIRNGESDGLIGLQFTSSVNDTWIEENSAEKYTFGTLLYPTANESSFDEGKTATENMNLVDAVNIIHVQNESLTTGTTFNASIIYDRQSVTQAIESKGATASDDLVDSVLRNLYNKDFTAKSYAVVNGETIYTNSYSTSMYKVASRTYALGDAEDNETYKNLALNYFTSASVQDAKAFVTDGAIVFNGATQPAFSQNAIVIRDNSVLASGVQYTISQEGVITISNALENQGKTVSYYVVDNGVLTVVNAEFVDVSITGIDVSALSSEYKRTDDVSNNLTFKFTYDNGTVSESYTLNEGNIYSIEIEGNVATVVVKVTVNNVVYSDEVTLTVSEEPSSVAEVLSATVGGEYMLNGVVVGFATTIDQNEVILADNNGNFISVAGLGGGKLVNGSYYVDGIDVGYEITIPVVLKNDGVGANANKLYASYAGGSNTDLSVISKNNAVSIPAEKLVIDSNEDLTALLSGGNQYKVVTLKGEMNFVVDNKYELYDFWFYDNSATKLQEIAVNGLIPSFSNVSTYITTGKMFNQVVFGKNATSTDFNNPHTVIKEITALYLGGNDTYAQFVLLNDNSVEDVTPTLTTKVFVEPKQLIYAVGDELNFEGSTITYNYDIRSSVTLGVTSDMVKNMPVIETAGNYTITINDGATDFTFEIQVLASRIKSIEVSTMPTKSTYNHRDSFETLDVSGGQILITYENGSSEYVDITKEMFNLNESDEWRIGTVNYALYYVGIKFTLPIVYENTALTISEFKSATVGETYDVTGVLVGPMSSWAYGELLIKDKNSDEMISVVHTETFGSSTALNLDTTVHNIGDEIIFSAKLYQTATDSTIKGSRGRYHADAIDKDTFVKSLIIISTGNSVKFNLSGATSISTYSELSSFITSWSNTYKFVKFSGLKGLYKNTGYMIFFGDAYSKVNSAVPYIDMRTSKKYVSNAQSATYFDNYKGATDDDCAVAKGDVYALYIGGNGTYLSFVILDADWFVAPTVTE